VGIVIKTQLMQTKGVRLASVGTFSLTRSGEPTFVAANELTTQYKLKFRPIGAPDNIPTTALNMTQLAQVAGLTAADVAGGGGLATGNSVRDKVDRIYNKFIACFTRAIVDGRDVLLTIHRVAEISVSKGVLTCEFMPQFLAQFASSSGSPVGKNVRIANEDAVDHNAAAMLARVRAMRLLQNAGAEKEKSRGPFGQPAAERAKSAAALVAMAEASLDARKAKAPPPDLPRNPITHERSSEISFKAAPARAVNPIIHAGEEGFDHDPFAEHRQRQNSQQRPQNRQQQQQQQPPRQLQQRGGGGSVGDFGMARPFSAGSVASNGTRSSADTLSLLHSPRSRVSSDNFGPSAGVGFGRMGGARVATAPSGGLRREQLERHAALENQRQMISSANNGRRGGGGGGYAHMDARAMAARALDVGDIARKVREKVVARGGSGGIKSLQRLLSIMDDSGDKRLSKDELKYGLRDYGITLSPTELDQIFIHFDHDRTGYISVDDFLLGIRGDLSERRKRIVRAAFNSIDTDGAGYITVDEIVSCYDMTWHPDVRSGKKTLKEATLEFMAMWENGHPQSEISQQEFEEHYKDISASIDDDDVFEQMMRNAWRIDAVRAPRVVVAVRGGGNKKEDVLATSLRSNRELGLERGGREKSGEKKKADGMIARLKASQGIDVDSIEVKQAKGGRPSAGAPAAMGARLSAAKEAWPAMGAPSPLVSANNSRVASNIAPAAPIRGAAVALSAAVAAAKTPSAPAFDAFEVLRRLAYNPPVSIEQLGARLAVSVVSFTPRVAKGALTSRLAVLDPSLDRSALASIWKAIDPLDVGSIDLATLHEMLASRFGKDKSSGKNSGIIDKVIAKILERCGGAGGIKGLQRVLAVMDSSGDKRLDKEELKYGLRDYGIELNIRELDEIFLFFDRDRNGFVDISEFLVGIRGDLNERRKKLVRMAFDILDTDQSGIITVDEVASVYDVSRAPDVISGKKTAEQALKEFMSQWEKGSTAKDGVITFEEFEDYYKEISASIDGDDYFELMIRNAWRIAGGEGAAANTANKRVLVTNKDGSQSVQMINKELGLKAGDKAGMMARLKAQGVDAENIELFGGLDATSKAAKAGGRPPAAAPVAAAAAKKPPVKEAAFAPISAKPAQVGARSAYDRTAAAIKLAAAFRGRMGRKKAAQVKRYNDAKQAALEEEKAEASRPRPRQIIRPVPKTKK